MLTPENRAKKYKNAKQNPIRSFFSSCLMVAPVWIGADIVTLIKTKPPIDFILNISHIYIEKSYIVIMCFIVQLYKKEMRNNS